MKKTLFVIIMILACAYIASAEDIDEGLEAYNSIITAEDFNYRPAFVETKYTDNDLFIDIAVSAVESVPFGFILGFIGIWVFEAASQGNLQPVLGGIEEYTPAYTAVIGGLAAVNIVVNTLFFYDYNKEKKNGEKNQEKQACVRF